MADYYPLLERAIGGLSQNTAEMRKAVFDRARAALLKQLRGVDPPLPEGEIIRERQALEEAIKRISAQYPAEAPAVPPSPPPRASKPEPEPEPAPARAPHERTTPSSRPEPEASIPAQAPDEPAAQDDAGTASTIEAEPGEAPATGKATASRPVLGKATVGPKTARPRLPKEAHAGHGPRWQRTIAITVLVAVLVTGGVLAAVQRDRIVSLFTGSSAPVTTAAPGAEPAKTGEPAKSTDRVAQAAGDAVRRSVPASTKPISTIAQRAVLFEESSGASQGLQSYEGTVTWRTESFSAGPGLPPDIGIRGDIQIPERRMAVSFTLRRNQDPALPASHTIEIGFTLPPDFAYGGIANVPVIRMKQTESAQGAPLAGLSVRVSPTYFLVGLSAVPADKQRNLQLLQTRPWIDIPVVYTNNKRGIIAFEKGPTGEQAFQDAFKSWGEFIPTPPPPMPLTPSDTAPAQ